MGQSTGQLRVEVTQDTSWNRALNEARRTVGKKKLDKEPSREWKLKSLMAEHSQIKLVEFTLAFENLRQWVGVHLLRHSWLLPFIHSQRADRRELDVPRDELPQGTPNDQDFVANAQTLINMARKRLCTCASKETREAFQLAKDELAKIDPETAAVLVPNCIYRGFCPEVNSCGFWKTAKFQKQLNEYRNLIQRGDVNGETE